MQLFLNANIVLGGSFNHSNVPWSLIPAGVPGSSYLHHQEAQEMSQYKLGSSEITKSTTNSDISTFSTPSTAMIYSRDSDRNLMPTRHSRLRTTESPFASRNPSVSSVSTASGSSHDYYQASHPSGSEGESIPSPLTPISHTSGNFKVTIHNLSPHSTKEAVCDLVEQKSGKYVTLAQPEPIKIRKFKGQVHACIKFARKNDAEKTATGLEGFIYKSRKLHTVLEC